MAMYIPKTMIGRAALGVWHQVGKEMTALEDAAYILGRVREPDMELVRRVAAEIGLPASTVDLCWTRLMDAILAQEEAEQESLDRFGEEPK